MNIITTATRFTCFDTKRIKYGFLTIKINNFWSYFTCSLNKSKHSIHTIQYYFSSSNTYIFNIIDCKRIIIYTKIINITSKSSFFFILSTNKSFEMFSGHIGPTTISESFALNL